MDSAERERLDRIIHAILDTVARETGKDREWLGLELEQVVTRGVFEAYRAGTTRRRHRSSTTMPVVNSDPEDS